MRRRRLWQDFQHRHNYFIYNNPSRLILTALIVLNCFSSILIVIGEVQIQRISDRVVPVPGGNVKGVIATITDDGPLRGRLVEQFYGIQFASVPERFLPPERPTDQWQGNRILWNPAPACPGPEYGGGIDDLRRAGYNRVARARLEAVISSAKVFDSDMYDWESTCLKMNIFVPYENRTANPHLRPNLRAVLVFIPAESYQFGSANAYNPTPLVAFGDIIVVTLNIRHGALGFLASGDQSSTGAPGNMALFDVVSALHWIRANIAAFGGDPHRITLLGHQHAAALVHLLMASPVVRGNRLFQRAILQGGSALSPYAIQSLAAAQSSMLALGLAAGCSEPLLRQVPILMRCLRNKTVQHLVNLNLKQSGIDDTFQPLVSSFGPTITSGNLLSIDLQELNERRLPYDVLLGASSHSGADLIPEECLSQRGCNSTDRMRIIKTLVRIIFHESRRRIIDVLAHQYKDHRRPDAPDAIAAELTKLLGDSYVVAPLIKTANIQSNRGRGNTVFFYVLDYGQSPIGNNTGGIPPVPSPTMPIALPGDELAYVFGAPLVSNLPPYSNRKYFPEERFLSETMMTYWANFVKTGNPNTQNPNKPVGSVWWRSVQTKAEEVTWPAYSTETREFLRIGAQVEADQRYKADMMALWLDLIPRLHSDGSQTGNTSPEFQPPLFPPPPPMPPPPLFMTEPVSSEIVPPSSIVEAPSMDAEFSAKWHKTLPQTTSRSVVITEPRSTVTPRGTIKPSKISEGMIVINPDELPDATSAEKLLVNPENPVTEAVTQVPNSWVPVVISGEEANLYRQMSSSTVASFPAPGVDPHTPLVGGLPLPLIVTVAIVTSLIVGNVVICTVVYCVRRKRRQQTEALANPEAGNKKNAPKLRTPPLAVKPIANGNTKHMNGTSPLHGSKYRGSAKTPDEIRPLHNRLNDGEMEIDFRGSSRRFEVPLETQIDTPTNEDVSRPSKIVPPGSNNKSSALSSSDSFDWRRHQHQQQLSSALNSTAQRPVLLSPGISLNAPRANHDIIQKCNSSGRLSVSLEDFACSPNNETNGNNNNNNTFKMNGYLQKPSPPPPPRPRNIAQPILSTPDDSNRSLLTRRNSLPKQLTLLHDFDDTGKRGSPQQGRQLTLSSNGLDQHPQHHHHHSGPSTMPRHHHHQQQQQPQQQQTPSERELAPISAIRLVNHARIVTPPSSSSASASAASPPTSSSSALSPSPLPLTAGNPGARPSSINAPSKNNRLQQQQNHHQQQQEPTICFLPAYRTASMDTTTPSPISLMNFQQHDRALPPPPPPPKPRQLLARYNQYNQQVKVVKFCEEPVEIPHDDDECHLLDNNGRTLPPSPPMETSSPSLAHRQLPAIPPQPRSSLMTNWSKVAVDASTTAPPGVSPKKVTLGSSRVTGL